MLNVDRRLTDKLVLVKAEPKIGDLKFCSGVPWKR